MVLEHGLVVLGALSLFSVPRRQMLWAIMLVAGSVVEISAVSFSAAFSGAGLITLSSAALARRRISVVTVLFASVFLVLLGAAILAAHARTENLELLRVELGSMTPSLARIAIPILWAGLVLRLVLLPLWLSRLPGVGPAITVGPGWLSGFAFAQHLSTIWPQSMVDGWTGICVNAAGVYAALMGLATIRGGDRDDWLHFVASGVGMMALISVWFGAETGPMWGRSVVLQTGTLLILLNLIERRPIPVPMRRGLRLLLLGFPLTGVYAAKAGILKSLSAFGAVPQMGALIVWIVPLVAVFAGPTRLRPGERRMPIIAQLIAVLAALYVAAQGGMVFRTVAQW